MDEANNILRIVSVSVLAVLAHKFLGTEVCYFNYYVTCCVYNISKM